MNKKVICFFTEDECHEICDCSYLQVHMNTWAYTSAQPIYFQLLFVFHIFSWIMVHIYSGRFVMSVGWGRRIDVYLVSIKAQGRPAFPFHISVIPQMALIKRLAAVTCFPSLLSCLSLCSAFPFFIYWISCTSSLHSLFILLCIIMYYSKHSAQVTKKNLITCEGDNIVEYVHQIYPEVEFRTKGL